MGWKNLTSIVVLVLALSSPSCARAESPAARTSARQEQKAESVDNKENVKRETLAEMIARHEGFRAMSYTDTTGNRTVAYGFNLERKDASEELKELGLNYNLVYSGTQQVTKEQGLKLMQRDINTATNVAKNYLPNFDKLPQEAQEIVIDMAYNMGGKLYQFKGMKSALIKNDYNSAADHMKNSKWYKQVGNRSKELEKKMRALVN